MHIFVKTADNGKHIAFDPSTGSLFCIEDDLEMNYTKWVQKPIFPSSRIQINDAIIIDESYGEEIINDLPITKFISCYTTGRFKNTNPDVINFIAAIKFRSSSADYQEGVEDLFSNGYCYYFACMLKAAFDRGDVCWHNGYGHIVWVDTNDIAYDINGVFDDHAGVVRHGGGDRDQLVPLENITDPAFKLDTFKHIENY